MSGRDEQSTAGYAGDVVDVEVHKAVADVARKAVKAAFTDDVRAQLQERAAKAADEAVTAQMQDEAPAEPEEPTLFYGSTDDFVREYLRYAYARRIDGATLVWAAEWWQYDQAVIRLEALWRSWDHLRLDAATGMSVWFRDHADHHMAVLMSSSGPFAAADTYADSNKCEVGEPLPYTAPPEGMFPDERPPAAEE